MSETLQFRHPRYGVIHLQSGEAAPEAWLRYAEIPSGAPLPEDLPHRDILAERYSALAEIREAHDEEILTIPGIGAGRLKQLRQYLETHSSGG